MHEVCERVGKLYREPCLSERRTSRQSARAPSLVRALAHLITTIRPSFVFALVVVCCQVAKLWKNITLTGLAKAGILVTVVLVSWSLVQYPNIAVEPITVPKELADLGYTPDVVARQLIDSTNTIWRAASTTTTTQQSVGLGLDSSTPDFVVPKLDFFRPVTC